MQYNVVGERLVICTKTMIKIYDLLIIVIVIILYDFIIIIVIKFCDLAFVIMIIVT